jgi:hypothetical protein
MLLTVACVFVMVLEPDTFKRLKATPVTRTGQSSFETNCNIVFTHFSGLKESDAGFRSESSSAVYGLSGISGDVEPESFSVATTTTASWSVSVSMSMFWLFMVAAWVEGEVMEGEVRWEEIEGEEMR